MSHSPLLQHIKSFIDINEDEANITEQAFAATSISKKKELLRAGNVSQYVFFVEKGCLRSFTIDEKGGEQIYQIELEGHWIGDLYSFWSQKPSQLSIDAIEDTDVRMISHTRLEKLYREVPKLERFFRILFQNAYMAVMEQHKSSIRNLAQDRYRQLINTQPDLLQRVPLVYIASFLGITPESLSRIRRNT